MSIISPLDNVYILSNSYLTKVKRSVDQLATVDTVIGFDPLTDVFQVPVVTASMNVYNLAIPNTGGSGISDLNSTLTTLLKSMFTLNESDAALVYVPTGAFAGEYLVVNTNPLAGFQWGSSGDLVVLLSGFVGDLGDITQINFVQPLGGTVLTVALALQLEPAHLSYSITDTAQNIAAAFSTSAAIIENAAVVTASGVATVAQAHIIDGFTQPVIYSLADTAEQYLVL